MRLVRRSLGEGGSMVEGASSPVPLFIHSLARPNGCQFTLGEVRKLARCRRCCSGLPFILVR
jgi:hypothetical protein